MSDIYRRRLTVLNECGLYARPSAMIVKTLQKFDTAVTVSNGSAEVNAGSIIGVLTLEGHQGRELLFTAEGREAREALEAITELFNDGFDSGEVCLPIPDAHSQFD